MIVASTHLKVTTLLLSHVTNQLHTILTIRLVAIENEIKQIITHLDTALNAWTMWMCPVNKDGRFTLFKPKFSPFVRFKSIDNSNEPSFNFFTEIDLYKAININDIKINSNQPSQISIHKNRWANHKSLCSFFFSFFSSSWMIFFFFFGFNWVTCHSPATFNTDT